MSKTMTQTIRGHNLKVTVAMVLIAVLVLLVVVALAYMMKLPSPTGANNPGIHAMNGAGGSSITQDPYIDRHAEVVARLGEGSLR